MLQAQALTAAGAATTQSTEATVLLAAAAAYVAVLRDRALLAASQSYLNFLIDQQKLITGRHQLGEITQADVEQAKNRLEGARIRLIAAQAAVKNSEAIYRQTIGVEPADLAPAPALDPEEFPKGLEAAVAAALPQHPAIRIARANVEAAELQVKITHAELAPTVSVGAAFGDRYDLTIRGDKQLSGAVVGQLNVPLFDGGLVSAKTREAQEIAAQRKLELAASG